MPKKEQRVQSLDEEVVALSKAEEVGALPAEDRREPEPVAAEPVVVAPVPEPAPEVPLGPDGFPVGYRVTTADIRARNGEA